MKLGRTGKVHPNGRALRLPARRQPSARLRIREGFVNGGFNPHRLAGVQPKGGGGFHQSWCCQATEKAFVLANLTCKLYF